MPPWLNDTLAFIADHRAFAAVIFGLLAFGESLAFIGILLPATVVMVACGPLVGAGTLRLADLWIGGAVGAALGDTVSYALGRWLGPNAGRLWPISRHPQLLAHGEAFFRRYGWAAVFFGRFVGPLRAMVPLAAGILGMPRLPFQLCNVLSAIVWIPVIVSPGVIAVRLAELARDGETAWAATLGLGVIGVAMLGYLAVRRWGDRLMPGRPPRG
jgi:membrane protein DedA with SNARE-associated domain